MREQTSSGFLTIFIWVFSFYFSFVAKLNSSNNYKFICNQPCKSNERLRLHPFIQVIAHNCIALHGNVPVCCMLPKFNCIKSFATICAFTCLSISFFIVMVAIWCDGGVTVAIAAVTAAAVFFEHIFEFHFLFFSFHF